MTSPTEKTGVFQVRDLDAGHCADCNGTGELRIDSENINEAFEWSARR
jgi:hypothetical protein